MKIFKFNPHLIEVTMSSKLKDELFIHRQTKFNDYERGGVIMGEIYPTSNRIKITHFLKCNHSVANKYGLELNVKKLQKEMDKIWKDSKGTITYLGDWHTHPQKDPKPSYIDYKTFFKNYYFSNFNQNILLYIILGNEINFWIKSFDGSWFRNVNNIIS